MKTLTGSLAAHVAGEVTTLATCWKVTRADGAVYGFTDHVGDLAIAGVSYLAATGHTASAVQTSAAMESDNLEVQGLLDGTIITASDLRAGKWDGAEVEIFQVNYRDPAGGANPLRKGVLGRHRKGALRFEAELMGLGHKLQQSIGRLYLPACNADLGDARCAVDLGTFPDGTVNGTLTAVASRIQVTDAGLSQAAGWFTHGRFEFTGGANVGWVVDVKTHAGGGVLTFQEPSPVLAGLADAYTLTAGCDKTHTTCFSKFNNIVNHRGFPHLPGLDKLINQR